MEASVLIPVPFGPRNRDHCDDDSDALRVSTVFAEAISFLATMSVPSAVGASFLVGDRSVADSVAD
jgi:hypothetical protein